MSNETEKYLESLNPEKINLTIPAILFKEGDSFTIMTTDETEKIIGQPLFATGKTREDAEQKLWEMLRFINEYNEERSRELNKYKFFQHGPWGEIGGSWFSILGINVYFRKGKNMIGGWYIPFTKMNIRIHNHWFDKKKNIIK